MIQAIGLTSVPRRSKPPAVHDVTFEAHAGRVTVLLGDSGAGKTTALRLLLQLEPGRGVALFRGRPLHLVPQPFREVGVLLGDVPGHPARTARSHLRMLGAAAGVPADRADDVLDAVGLSGLADQPLGTFSLGMDRRLGLAAALLGDPHTLVLDEPAHGLSPREAAWLHRLLRGYADHGGTVLITVRDPKEAARLADRVVTLDGGRLVADQSAAAFARTRLRPRVIVRSPHAARLAAALDDESRPAGRPVEVVREAGNQLAVYGSSCAAVGETAYRHGVVVHRLADEIGDTGPVTPLDRADGRRPVGSPHPESAVVGSPAEPGSRTAKRPPGTPPVFERFTPPGPSRPLRYELHRASGVRTGWFVAAAALAASLIASVALALTSSAPATRLLAGWPAQLPLPPAAIAAGLLGALAFGQEYRYPALAHAQGTVPHRLGLLAAKLAVSGAAAVALGAMSVFIDGGVLLLLFGSDTIALQFDWTTEAASWAGLGLGCAWAGLLAAGLFRSTSMGLAAVLAVPVLVLPALQMVLSSPATRSFAVLPGGLRSPPLPDRPSAVDRWITLVLRLLSQPIGQALTLSLVALLCGYLFVTLRRRAR